MMRLVALILITLGISIHVFVAFAKSSNPINSFAIWLMVLASLPYTICAVFLWKARSPAYALAASALLLFLDSVTYYNAFVDPQSSTASLGVVFEPMWNLVLFLPLGLGIGWLVTKVKKHN